MIFPVLLALSLQLPSPLGKAATAQLRDAQTQKQRAIAEKQAEVQQLSRSSAAPARVQRAQVELQRLTRDAEEELAALDQQLQKEFDKKLRPIVAKIAEEEHIGIIFEYPQQLILWSSPSIDVTAKVIARLDAEAKRKP